MPAIDNTEDIIDSRDIIERIEELEAICLPVRNVETGEDELDPSYTESEREDAAEELATLKAVAVVGEDYIADWEHGEALIRDSYFEDHARELAHDCGMVDEKVRWPMDHIDWEAVAETLKQDYTELDFDGVTYWAR